MTFQISPLMLGMIFVGLLEEQRFLIGQIYCRAGDSDGVLDVHDKITLLRKLQLPVGINDSEGLIIKMLIPAFNFKSCFTHFSNVYNEPNMQLYLSSGGQQRCIGSISFDQARKYLYAPERIDHD